MRNEIYIEAINNGYDIDQCGRTFTVGELIEFLNDYDEDTKVYLRFDNGYTFGSITEDNFNDIDE